jgi:hypothetical protein
VKPTRSVSNLMSDHSINDPNTGLTALRKLALSQSKWTIPKPSAQCSKMPMIISGSPKEPKNEQQDAGHSQSSSVRSGEIARELAVMGYSKRGARRTRRHASKDAAVIPL